MIVRAEKIQKQCAYCRSDVLTAYQFSDVPGLKWYYCANPDCAHHAAELDRDGRYPKWTEARGKITPVCPCPEHGT